MRIALNGGLGSCGISTMSGYGLGADEDCPCEVTEVTENKTVTIPVKSQKIICKPTTTREGVVDCETIQRALGQRPAGGSGVANTNNTLPATNNNTAGGPANLLGLGDINAGFNIDLVSLALGAGLAYVVVKVL